MTLQDKMYQLSDIRIDLLTLAPLVERYKRTEADYKQLKQDILADLDAMGSRGTDYIAGIRATKSARKTLTVTDRPALLEWLNNNIEDTTPYIREDAKAVEKLAKEVEDKTGAPPAGSQFETKYSLRIEEEKINTDSVFN